MSEELDPLDVAALEKSLNDSAVRVSTVWVSYLIFALYLVVGAGTVPYRQVLLEDPIKLPVLNIDLPFYGFFLIAPVIFVIFHAYVLLQVLLLGRTAHAYNVAIDNTKISPSNDALIRQRLSNTLFAQIFAGSSREREGPIGLLLKLMAWVTLAIAPVLVLLVFEFKFLPYHSHFVTWAHRFLIFIELTTVFMLWPLVLDARRDVQWSRVLGQPATLACAAVFVIVSLCLATFPGEPHINLITGYPIQSVQCDRWVSWQWDRLFLPREGAIDPEKLEKIARATNAKGYKPYQGERTRNFHGRDLRCGHFEGADLRRADFTLAHSEGANFTHAELQGAIFDNAYLGHSSFSNALLTDASLDGAQMQASNFEKADLRRAKLKGVNLEGSALEGATLRGAILDDAELSGTNFKGAHFEGASLLQAKFLGALLDEAHFEGASLSSARMAGVSLIGAHLEASLLDRALLIGAALYRADLRGASLDEAQLQGAKLNNAKIQGASLELSFVWRADPIPADFKNNWIHDLNTRPRYRWVQLGCSPTSVCPLTDKVVGDLKDLIEANVSPEDLRRNAVTGISALYGSYNSAEQDAEIAQNWDKMANSGKNITDYRDELASLLLSVICRSSEDIYILRGIIRNGTIDSTGAQNASKIAEIAQDPKRCASSVDLEREDVEALKPKSLPGQIVP